MWFVLYMFGGIFLEKKLDFKDPAFFSFYGFICGYFGFILLH
jgi:hypothetical protein